MAVSGFRRKLQALLESQVSLRRLDLALAVLITLAALVVYFSVISSNTRATFQFVENVELRTLDMRFNLRGARPHDDNVVIIGIDEKTLGRVGAYPIPRNAYATLLDQLTKGGARVVSFDINFTSPEKNSAVDALQKVLAEIGSAAPATIVQKIRDIESTSDNDRILAEAIKNSNNVILGHTFFVTKEQANSVSAQTAADYYNVLSNRPIPRVQKAANGKDFSLDSAWQMNGGLVATGIDANIRLLAEPAKSYGFFNETPDSDGTFRRALFLIRYQNLDFYPSLDVETVREYENIKDESIVADVGPIGLTTIELGPHTITTASDGTALVNYAGPYNTYRHYSMIDVMNGTVPSETFRGKIVLLGYTALAVGDIRNTPFANANYMGVEIHANTVDNILHNEESGRGFLSRGFRENMIDVFFILLFGLGLGYWFSVKRPIIATATLLGTAIVFLGINYFAFARFGMWLAFVVPMGTLLGNYASIISTRVFFEEREKRQVRKMFARYVPPGVIGLMEKDPKKYFKTGGELKELTVMFSDIRSFTTIAEGLSPDELVRLLNEYLSEMTDIIFANWGTLDKYIGDAVMAFWGSPFPQTDHFKSACQAALKMSARLDELNLKWEVEGKKRLNIGVGINTGIVNVGNMGSSQRFAWTVMGDHVNLASRLEGITKDYRVRIVISESTYEYVKDEFVFRELDKIRVKGKTLPVTIYQLLDHVRNASRYNDLLVHWSDAYSAYKRRHWPEAAEKFEAMLGRFPEDGPAQVYLERVYDFNREAPASDWDGVYVMKHK